uniref:Uncharacterized protein TCIL3000_9_3710 n=1 Tax=Trypanosoma congolense (strain IL3000) TaxID=1068625 RepID=G0UUA7_TRYCI|nr:unnamed protein product [Trypanosoma congolense IL3000]
MRTLRRHPALRMLEPTLSSAFMTSQRSASSEEKRTYFDYIDSLWNRQWFGAAEQAEVLSQDPSCLANLLVTFQGAVGLGAPEAILFFGALTRFITLGLSLYGERASERMRDAIYRLRLPHETYQRVYHSQSATALDIQLAATALKEERRRVFAEEKTSSMQCLSSVLGSPLVLMGIVQVKSLCENPYLNFGTSSFLWCNALAMPDPYGILPLAFCGLTLANFELSIRKELKTGWMSNIIWGARLACLCVLPVTLQLRSGVCLFFLGMGFVGMLQPLLLRASWFRDYFNFPKEPMLSTDNFSYAEDGLHARMSVQFPYMSHIFDSVAEENSHLVEKAPETPGIGKKRTVNGGISFTTPGKSAAGITARKGAEFAAPGWKAQRMEFSEEDLLPQQGSTGSGSGNCRKREERLKDTRRQNGRR